jgi:hypothetical protein
MANYFNPLISEEMTKSEIKDLVKDVLDSELKNRIKDGKLTDEDKVRDIIKNLLKKHYKTLWTKANYFIEEL